MNRSESKYFNTAKKMDEALVSLLEVKDFAYITVSEICKIAGVNRSTFYLHYETLGDLLEETTRYLINDFRAYFPQKDVDLTTALKGGEEQKLNFITEQYLYPYLSYIMDHRWVFSAALSNIGTLGFDRVFRRMYEQVFEPILAHFGYSEVRRPYVIQYYLNGVTAIVTLWLKNGCKESIEEIADTIEECIFGRKPWMSFVLE
ncbi:MAG: TetR/AcrR family transcriptional regulator [Ruminococcaceae bacterium]|nr:TetR/AcrR family transcriptional regulator [Oscillospiraceae bacterium]